jgi:YD repeat-containing protein
VEADETREYLWDRNGRLALAKNGAMMLQWFHDLAGNMVAEHRYDRKSGLTAVWRHGYDPLGNRVATPPCAQTDTGSNT